MNKFALKSQNNKTASENNEFETPSGNGSKNNFHI